MSIQALGIDIGKSVFHLVGLNGAGRPVLKRKLSRRALMPFMAKLPPCVVGMEACPGSQYLARRLSGFDHTVCLMAAQFVKPYVKSNKSDLLDAQAIAEAVTRPTMRFVPIKTPAQQELQALHRVRALMAELWQQIAQLEARISALTAKLSAIAGEEASCRRLLTVPGVGPLTATALVAAVDRGQDFRRGRELAAWLGLVPRQYSTGGKPRLLGISKRGNVYLRTLLIHGARAVLRSAERRSARLGPWLVALKRRRPANIVAVALANKLARTAWAVLVHDEDYRPAINAPV